MKCNSLTVLYEYTRMYCGGDQILNISMFYNEHETTDDEFQTTYLLTYVHIYSDLFNDNRICNVTVWNYRPSWLKCKMKKIRVITTNNIVFKEQINLTANYNINWRVQYTKNVNNICFIVNRRVFFFIFLGVTYINAKIYIKKKICTFNGIQCSSVDCWTLENDIIRDVSDVTLTCVNAVHLVFIYSLFYNNNNNCVYFSRRVPSSAVHSTR